MADRVARRVREAHHARRLGAAPVDADDAAAAHGLELIAVEHVDDEPALGRDGDRDVGHLAGVEVCRRRVGQVACERRGCGRRRTAFDAECGTFRAGLTDHDDELGERAGGGFALDARVPVGGQQRPLHHGLGGIGRIHTGRSASDVATTARRPAARTSEAAAVRSDDTVSAAGSPTPTATCVAPEGAGTTRV